MQCDRLKIQLIKSRRVELINWPHDSQFEDQSVVFKLRMNLFSKKSPRLARPQKPEAARLDGISSRHM